MNTKDWLKLAGGLALVATGLGAAGVGPLAGLLGGAGAGAGAAGATGAAAGGALGSSVPLTGTTVGASKAAGLSALAKQAAVGSAISTGGQMGLSALSPSYGMSQVGNVPQLQTPDTMAMIEQLMARKRRVS